jgi:hypothetical protein
MPAAGRLMELYEEAADLKPAPTESELQPSAPRVTRSIDSYPSIGAMWFAGVGE